ncbi:MAG: hypothetical protein ACOWWR_10315 [Eubacteriales bacterium]
MMNKKLDDDFSNALVKKKNAKTRMIHFPYEDESVKRSFNGKRQKKNWIREYEQGILVDEE